MSRFVPVLMSLTMGIAGSAQAPLQVSPNGGAAFDVASVKANTSGERGLRVAAQPGGRFVADNATLLAVLEFAFNVRADQVLGGPGWIHSDRFDIAAKAPDDTPQDQLPEMARTLLVDRFKLVARHETRELPIYALMPARDDRRLGPQLTPSSADCERILAERGAGGSAPVRFDERPVCGARQMARLIEGRGVTIFIAGGGTTLAELTSYLSRHLRRDVVDRTGLTGRFDLDLQWAPEPVPEAPPGAPAGPDLGVSMFTALQEQLGLKLQSERGPVDVVVIESVEQPTED